MSKRIYFSGNHTDKYCTVDDEDYEYLSQFKWYLVDGYATRHLTKEERTAGMSKQMHRQILGLGKKDKKSADHINGDGSCNEKHNLRVADKKQNGANAKKNPNKSSKYKGVSWCKRRQKWKSYINPNGKYVRLGDHDNEEDAAKAYDNAAIKYFGEFAKLNF